MGIAASVDDAADATAEPGMHGHHHLPVTAASSTPAAGQVQTPLSLMHTAHAMAAWARPMLLHAHLSAAIAQVRVGVQDGEQDLQQQAQQAAQHVQLAVGSQQQP